MLFSSDDKCIFEVYSFLFYYVANAGTPENFIALANTTSSSITLQWTLGRDGNHPNIDSHLEINSTVQQHTHTRYSSQTCSNGMIVQNVVVEDGVQYSTVQLVVEGLEPDSTYDFSLVAHNQREQHPESDVVYLCSITTNGMDTFFKT